MTLTVTHVLKSEDKDSGRGGTVPSLKYTHRSIYIGFIEAYYILYILHIY